MSATAPQTSDDSPKLWARQYIKLDTDANSKTIDLNWTNHLEKSLEITNHNQWLAYQVLKGDLSNWRSATAAANWELIEVQSEQLKTYINELLDLSPQQRRSRFAELELCFQNNSIALNRLATFRPLLELDSRPPSTLTRDMLFLMQSAARLLIDKPSDRHIGYAKIMAIVAKEPARWEAVANQIRNQSPKINQIAPDLFLRISNYRADQNQFRLDEKASIRRTFLARTRIAMNRSRFLKSSAAIYIGLIFLGVIIKITAESVNRPESSAASPKTWDLTESQKQAFVELLGKPNSAKGNRNGLFPLAEEIILHPEKYDQVLNLAPPPPGLIEATARYVKNWARIATLEGTKGLDKEEKTLIDMLTPLNKDNVDSIEKRAIEIRLQLFRSWRESDGNRLAKTRDSVEQIMKSVDGNELRLLERAKGPPDEQ